MSGLPSFIDAGFIFAVVLSTTPILYAALGTLFTQQANILNVALEGMMLVAAFMAIAVGAATQSLALAILAAVASSTGLALIFAYVSLVLRADFIVAGIGINLFASGLTVYLLNTVYGAQGSYQPDRFPAMWTIKSDVLGSIPVLGPALNGQSVLVYTALIAVVLSHIVLYRTKIGVHIRATGENPEAVEAVGLSPRNIKFICVLISGVAGGLGGAQLAMATLDIFAVNMTSGRGFIGLAAMLFGGVTPVGAFAASLVFGAADGLADRLQFTNIPPEIVLMIPYVVTVIALTLTMVRRRRRV